MSLFKQFETNEKLEKSGILLPYGVTDEGKRIYIRIARAGGSNKQFDRRLEALSKPIRRQLQNDIVDMEQLDSIMRRVYAETVVLGWENVQDKDGKDIPFSVENCIQLFLDLPDLFSDIQEQARRAAIFRQSNLDVAAGN